ncbi:hypothetical protein ER308_15780 [Egibacter rhizosphaerae]|uniref:Leucine-binding protein domain-containing protein n=1 Tax=Egibacter rhizosphaerae TaxID=1670831 RepID=A0A411YHZ7_9ACTN|nr:amino acid ABC transporter substrate-binding protein [Egibacter rhizosphaerae]QBI20888.1 hypothetical protein ER308_15780 [Egibacter rhizosphaerae]
MRSKWKRGATVCAVLAALALLTAACEIEDPEEAEGEDAPDDAADEPDDEADESDDEADEPDDETDEPDDADDEDEAVEGEPDGDPIVIGGSLGLTGGFAEPSAGYLAAYEYWEERINEEGGLLGRPVELQIYDDESTPDVAQDLYQRLINEDEVDLLLAPYTTAVGGAVIPIAERNEMLLWNGGFVGVELFQSSDWLVGSFTYQDPEYARGIFEMVEAMPENERPERIGIATEQNPFTLVVRDGFEEYPGVLERADDLGIEVVVEEEYSPDATDVSGIIQNAMAEDVDLFFALSLPDGASLLARTANELGFQPDIYCSCGSQVTTVPYWKDLGDAGEGVMATTMSWPPADDFPELDELHEVLQEEFGWEEMPTYASGALAILQTLEQSVEEVGSLDQEELREHVTNNSFETATGPLDLDENRMPAYYAAVVQFVDGQNELVWPEDRATAEPEIPMPTP